MGQHDEIATPEIPRHYPHLVDIASEIPPLSAAPVLLLQGRYIFKRSPSRFGPKSWQLFTLCTAASLRLGLDWRGLLG